VAGQEVEVTGRNAGSSWFSIHYPPGSTLTGWIPKTAIDFPGDVSALPVAALTPLPQAVLPTSLPVPKATALAPGAVLGPTPSSSASVSLTVAIIPGTCEVGQRPRMKITNNGPAAMINRPITILIQGPNGDQVALLSSQPITLQPGQTSDIETVYTVTQPVIVIVDPLQSLDASIAGNRTNCGGAVQLPTPPLVTPPAVPTTVARTPTTPVR
jgi:hypothetical protein